MTDRLGRNFVIDKDSGYADDPKCLECGFGWMRGHYRTAQATRRAGCYNGKGHFIPMFTTEPISKAKQEENMKQYIWDVQTSYGSYTVVASTITTAVDKVITHPKFAQYHGSEEIISVQRGAKVDAL
jgi:hypothetical protein